MLEIKILITPFFILRVAIAAERNQRIAAHTVKVNGVAFKPIVGCQIHAAAEPPYGLGIGALRITRLGDEKTHIHMRGRHIRIARMHDQGNAHRLPGPAGEMRPRRGGRWRQLISGDK